jgi:outer membrane lipoprotein SlyB
MNTKFMKLPTVSLILAASAVVWTGCVNSDGTPNNTGTGILSGAAVGALMGAAIGGPRHAGTDAAFGAAAGAVAGGLVGLAADQQQNARLQAQAPTTYVRVNQQQPLTTTDVKALVKAGISDDVVISQIVSTHTGFHLTSEDIIDLRNAGVSDRVVNFMIGTASDPLAIVSGTPTVVVVSDAPPAPLAETIVVAAPGPDYVWIHGDWAWSDGHWVWMGGHWANPPHVHGTWIAGYWVKGPHGWYRTEGYWK